MQKAPSTARGMPKACQWGVLSWMSAFKTAPTCNASQTLYCSKMASSVEAERCSATLCAAVRQLQKQLDQQSLTLKNFAAPSAFVNQIPSLKAAASRPNAPELAARQSLHVKAAVVQSKAICAAYSDVQISARALFRCRAESMHNACAAVRRSCP